jgi:hypothetical protein
MGSEVSFKFFLCFSCREVTLVREILELCKQTFAVDYLIKSSAFYVIFIASQPAEKLREKPRCNNEYYYYIIILYIIILLYYILLLFCLFIYYLSTGLERKRVHYYRSN